MSVGQSLPHDSAHLHVTGQARYLDDLPLPEGALHLCFGLSSEAHATLKALDLAAVREAEGVVAVITHADLERPADCSPSAHDEPLLADGAVHYIGQPVFLVIATSHLAARTAARLARISYAPLPAILSYDEALAADSRFGPPVLWQMGDAAQAIAGAEVVLEGQFEMGGQEHFYLEGQAALALPLEDGGMHVVSSTQHPSEIQHKVAAALGVRYHKIRVECRRMGGGFGGKESQGNALAIACALAARLTGRACKMRYDRDDDMMITGKRHDFRIRYRVGARKDGKVLGLEMRHETRAGWAQDLTHPVADRAMLHSDNAYHLPNLHIESHRLRTHTQSATAFRGFGGPQGLLAVERVMDHLAHHLGQDPLALRRRNFYDDIRLAEGEQRHGLQTTHYGQEIRDFNLHEMVADLALRAGYDRRRAEIAAWNQTHSHLKRGLALTPVKFGISFTLTHLNQAGALVHVYADGSVHLNHGGTEMGQGLFQKIAQVAAAEFGVAPEAIAITATDTEKVPNTSATAASSGTDLNGLAVQDAAQKIRARMAEFLALEAGCDISDVTFADGHVQLGPLARITFAEAAARCYQGRVSLSQSGFYKTPEISWDRQKGRGTPFYYFAYGASLSEVVIDTLTGEARILRSDILHDVGDSLNPALDIGQIEGGFVQGAGWLTIEELVWDAKGRLRTHAPSTYKIPAVSDPPKQMNVHLWHKPNPRPTIYRSKAVGEPPFMHGISVFMAIADAVSAARGEGAPYADLQAPATSERILAALRAGVRDD